jgi:hypothetical protein
MADWGTTKLKINYKNYNRQEQTTDIVEIQLLPVAGSTSVCTALQEKGRGRDKYTFEALVRTWAEYQTFVTDKRSKQIRTFADGNVSLDCIILTLGPAVEKIPGHIVFNMILMEA